MTRFMIQTEIEARGRRLTLLEEAALLGLGAGLPLPRRPPLGRHSRLLLGDRRGGSTAADGLVVAGVHGDTGSSLGSGVGLGFWVWPTTGEVESAGCLVNSDLEV
jgi:hypothetical protein